MDPHCFPLSALVLRLLWGARGSLEASYTGPQSSMHYPERHITADLANNQPGYTGQATQLNVISGISVSRPICLMVMLQFGLRLVVIAGMENNRN